MRSSASSRCCTKPLSTMPAARDWLGEPHSVTLSKGHTALIEEIYRIVHVMGTLERKQLRKAKRGEDLDNAARRTMEESRDDPVRRQIAGTVRHITPSATRTHGETRKEG